MLFQPNFYAKKWALLFLILGVFTGCESGPKVEWKKFDEASLQSAIKSGRPTLVYFYAAWCRPCQQLRSSTFRDERVINKLAEWNRLKADMSFRENKLTIQRGEKFKVWGLPTLLFYDSNGNEAARKSGFISAENLIDAVREAGASQN